MRTYDNNPETGIELMQWQRVGTKPHKPQVFFENSSFVSDEFGIGPDQIDFITLQKD